MLSERFEMRFSAELLQRLDEWRRLQSDLPARAEAIRRLIERGLSVEDKIPVRRAGPGSGSDQDAKNGTLNPAPRTTKPAAPPRKAEPAAAPRSKLDQIRALRERDA